MLEIYDTFLRSILLIDRQMVETLVLTAFAIQTRAFLFNNSPDSSAHSSNPFRAIFRNQHVKSLDRSFSVSCPASFVQGTRVRSLESASHIVAAGDPPWGLVSRRSFNFRWWQWPGERQPSIDKMKLLRNAKYANWWNSTLMVIFCECDLRNRWFGVPWRKFVGFMGDPWNMGQFNFTESQSQGDLPWGTSQPLVKNLSSSITKTKVPIDCQLLGIRVDPFPHLWILGSYPSSIALSSQRYPQWCLVSEAANV